MTGRDKLRKLDDDIASGRYGRRVARRAAVRRAKARIRRYGRRQRFALAIGAVVLLADIILSGHVAWSALLAIILVTIALDMREEQTMRAQQIAAREALRADQAREFAAQAEVALHAVAERGMEAEHLIATGVKVQPGIWIDGEWIPVDDGEDGDTEVGSPVGQP